MTVTPRFDLKTLGRKLGARGSGLPFPVARPAPILIGPERESTVSLVSRRTKIWEFAPHLHCSIIGTCLSTGELRQILDKADFDTDGASDHDLHSQGVRLAGQRGGPGKLLHKALDKRHRWAIKQFEDDGRRTRSLARLGQAW